MRKWFLLILALLLCLMCTAAMAECEHSDSIVPNTNGTHSHVCTLCGENMGDEDCADSCDDSDSACDWCGSTAVEADNYHFDDPTCKVEGGKHVVTCGCGVVVGSYDPKPLYPIDDMFHAVGCSYCLGANGEQKPHVGMGSGTDNGDGTCTYTCADCGYTYEGKHAGGMGVGDGFHGECCNTCSAWVWKEDCSETCTDQDGECDTCGSSDLTVIHGEITSTISGGKCNHVCNDCGETLEAYDVEWIPEEARPSGKTGHFAECSECGKEGANETPHTYKYATTADAHTAECTVCGWEEDEAEHSFADGTCTVCGYVACPHETLTCSGTGAVHTATCIDCGAIVADYPVETTPWTWLEHGTGCGICAMNGTMVTEPCTITNKSTADVCSYVCTVCGHDWSSWNDGKHSFDEYTATNSDHTTKCITCGYAVTEAHVYTDDDDNDCDVCGKTKKCQHTYWYTVRKQATCTEDGIRVDYCNLCGKEHGTQAIPAKGHNLSTEDMGDYILESCSSCDYENKIEKAVEQPAEEAPAEEAPIVDGLQVAEADETVVLPENVTAAKAFTVTLMKEGQAVQPEEATTVTLTLTEEELAAIDGLTLVLVQADGTLVEIPYEVVDGQVVFTAEALGAFAFVAK